MSVKSIGCALATTIALASAPAYAGCAPSDKIDSTTFDQAMHRIKQAGYRHVHEPTKGCDNYWHAVATKDGVSVGVVVTPKGEVMTEGS
ncbi:MAG TPA: hypothetical protein VLV76_13110 [Candidatus Acidoferrum sp.]|nr:hypothetical protein [Candidatus Acidoferrum sp.]